MQAFKQRVTVFQKDPPDCGAGKEDLGWTVSERGKQAEEQVGILMEQEGSRGHLGREDQEDTSLEDVWGSDGKASIREEEEDH